MVRGTALTVSVNACRLVVFTVNIDATAMVYLLCACVTILTRIVQGLKSKPEIPKTERYKCTTLLPKAGAKWYLNWNWNYLAQDYCIPADFVFSHSVSFFDGTMIDMLEGGLFWMLATSPAQQGRYAPMLIFPFLPASTCALFLY